VHDRRAAQRDVVTLPRKTRAETKPLINSTKLRIEFATTNFIEKMLFGLFVDTTTPITIKSVNSRNSRLALD